MAAVGLFFAVLLLGGSFVGAVWIGTRCSRAVPAFLVAWGMTPVLMMLGALLIMPIMSAAGSATNDGTWAIMIPFYGAAIGLPAGIAAAVVIARRTRKPAGPLCVGESAKSGALGMTESSPDGPQS